jgi:hypothetical protein
MGATKFVDNAGSSDDDVAGAVKYMVNDAGAGF